VPKIPVALYLGRVEEEAPPMDQVLLMGSPDTVTATTERKSERSGAMLYALLRPLMAVST
jgi:hypothetical protein